MQIFESTLITNKIYELKSLTLFTYLYSFTTLKRKCEKTLAARNQK